MGRLPTRPADCEYNEYDRRLTEQFIHWLHEEDITGEILREMLALENTDDTTRHNITQAKEFGSIRPDKQKHDNLVPRGKKLIENCKYCGTEHF